MDWGRAGVLGGPVPMLSIKTQICLESICNSCRSSQAHYPLNLSTGAETIIFNIYYSNDFFPD